MKYLKYALLVIAILVILFFAKGMITPSVNYDCKVTVNKSAAEAWAVMSDETNAPKWIKGIKKMELVKGPMNTVGAVSKIYIEENGQEMVMEETITAIKPNEHIAMTFTMDFMNMEYEMFMTEKDGKTEILSKSKTIGNGMLAKSIVSFMPKTMQAQENENLNSLKKIIDENTKNYFQEFVQDTLVENTK